MLKQNMFTRADHQCVRKDMKMLSPQDYYIIRLRFWENLLIEEIAKKMRISWSEADRRIEEAIKKLRAICLKNPKFNKYTRTQKLKRNSKRT